jgi:subtilase family serine protease
MRRIVIGFGALALSLGGLVSLSTTSGVASAGPGLVPLTIQAPGGAVKLQADWLAKARSGSPSGCAVAGGALHCYIASDIRQAYGVDQLPEKGEGQTIVLVDSYGSPQAADELQNFHDAFMPGEPQPNFDQVFPLGRPDYKKAAGNGQSGPASAAGWAGEAALDVQWAYAIAPRAHIVLLAVPPAETLGVQGFPNLFKAMVWAVGNYPAGTIFSMSFGVSEPTFGGATAVQTAKFDQVFLAGIAKGDSFFAASGDDGRTGLSKQQKSTRDFNYPITGWPASSPYVVAVGGTQLQYGWTWNPQSDVPFNPGFNGAYFASTTDDAANTNVVWNESWLPAATGGGPSAIYARPAAQDPVAGAIGGNARGVPDLSWNAAVNGATLVYLESFLSPADQGFYLIGGTSAASPQAAALTALANQRRTSANKVPLGDVVSKLYTLPANAFKDVVPVHQGAAGVISGELKSNTMFADDGAGTIVVGPIPGAATLPGYDMTTGLGTPWAPTYVGALAAL